MTWQTLIKNITLHLYHLDAVQGVVYSTSYLQLSGIYLKETVEYATAPNIVPWWYRKL